jgi:septum formation protein
MLFSLIENLSKVDIILASASPRRYELLKSIGLDFRVVPSHVPENLEITMTPAESVISNARKKGREVAGKFPKSLVISADTIVVLGDRCMGKPQSEQDAFDMLRSLSGQRHLVYTAIGLTFQKYARSNFDVVSTEVTFRKITDEEIWAYINAGEPFDKAGAYGIQGQGAILVEKINGCFFNVVGFPLSRFFIMLDEFLSHFVL